MRQSDRDVFWIISLAWFEQIDVYHPGDDNKPMLHYGRTIKYETFAEAEAAVERFTANTSWAPIHAIEPTVSQPTHVARKVRET